MRVHDFHLESYQVLNRGQTIKLHLVYGYPGEETDKSDVLFEGVTLYHFINSHGTIITDIEEVPLVGLLESFASELKEWNRMYGVKHWDTDFPSYTSKLNEMGLRAWEITSAIGFYGFVVAKEASNA